MEAVSPKVWEHDMGALHIEGAAEGAFVEQVLHEEDVAERQGGVRGYIQVEEGSSEEEGSEERAEEEEEEKEPLLDRFGNAITSVFARSYLTMKRVVISEETEGMLEEVMKIANVLLDSEYSSVHIMGACRILSGFRSNQPLLTNIPMNDLSVLKHVFYWWQFAEAAFGWALINGIKFEHGLRGFASGIGGSNEEVLQSYCKLKKEDIRRAQWDSRPALPGHYIAVDHRTHSIVWAVRGTFGLNDVLTDLMAHSVPFLSGQYLAHKGMAQAVQGLVDKCWTSCVAPLLLKEFPGYRLVTTGHSMGAAVATMLAIWVRHHHPDVPIACWAFACPPCISLNLAESTRDYVFGVTYGDDVITRASVESLLMLKQRLRHILQVSPGIWKSITQGVSLSSQVEGQLESQGILIGDRWKFEVEKEREFDKWAERLWPPMRQLYIYEVGDKVFAEESDCRNFGSIVLSNNMFRHHLPMQYDRTLIALIRQMKREAEQKKQKEG